MNNLRDSGIELADVAEHRKGGDAEVEVVDHGEFPPPDGGAAMLLE